MRDGEERNRTYDWARRHGLHDPYTFALHYSRLWGDPAESAEAARLWQRRHLLVTRRSLAEQVEELRRRIEALDAELECNETERLGVNEEE